MRRLYLIIVLLFMVVSCKDYHKDMIHWSDSIPIGTPISEVKKQQPVYLKIDWEHPEKDENGARYFISEIKGNRDILNMAYYLNFVDDKYQGREAHK